MKRLDFASVEEYVSKVRILRNSNYTMSSKGFEWDGGVSSPQAIHKAIHGDKDIAALANDVVAKISPQVGESMSVRRVHCLAGGSSVDVPAYLAGSPMCMVRRQRAPSQTGHVSIYVCISANGAITADTLFARGCAILSLLESLQAMQVNVDLSLVTDHSTNKGEAIFQVIRVENRPLDLSTAAFAIAHPAFVRNVAFIGAREWLDFDGQAAYQSREYHSQTGHHNHVPDSYPKWLREMLDLAASDILIPRVSPGDKLLSAPAKWIEEHISQLA